MLNKCFSNLKENGALCHNITNYVTVNDCANITIAIGASPIMADEIQEVEDIQTICNGLNINIGTLNERVVKSMIVAGKTANKCGHPVLLDPVGFAASKYRTDSSLKLIDNIKFSVIKGNISEIKSLATDSKSSFGVDACDGDKINNSNLKDVIKFAKKLSKTTGAVIVITGEIDLIADEKTAIIVRNGDPMMSAITGSGCMLSSLITAFISSNKDNIFEAAATAVISMGIAGERAALSVRHKDLGFSSFRTCLIDEISKLREQDIDDRGKYEQY